MLISDQLRRAFFLLVATMAAACAIFLGSYTAWTRSAGARNWAHEVVRLVFQCYILGTEDLAQPQGRAEEQYKASSAALGRLLENPPHSGDAQGSARDILTRKTRVDELLLGRVDRVRNRPAGTDLPVMLHGQIMLQATGMLGAAQALYLRADREANRIRLWSLFLVLGAFLGVAVTAAAVFRRVNRRILAPLQQLTQGVQRLGAGELNFRLNFTRQDELGVLANSFDHMAEQLARRQHALQEKLQDLDTFCYSLAHDLKAPLRGVAGLSELLEMESSTLSDEAQGYCRAMREASLKMGTLIDDLLEYGALTHQKFRIESVSISALVTEVLEDLKPEIARRNGLITASSDLPFVQGNRAILRQVLINLLTNALKFAAPGRSPRIQISSLQEGGQCRLEVRDNGIGISPEHHTKIFGLFQRLHREADYPGTGVGLAMVEKGVHLLGGTVGVDSIPGQGSTFWIKLPSADSEAKLPATLPGDSTREPALAAGS